MKRAALLGVVLLGVLTAPQVASADTGPFTFADPAGDSSTAPDITGVSVGMTPQHDFTFTIATSSVLTTASTVWLYVNTDNSCATGDPKECGADELFEASSAGYGAFFWDPDAKRWRADSPNSVYFTLAPDGHSATFQMWDVVLEDRYDVGSLPTDVFEFLVYTSNDGGTNVDRSPDTGPGWTYDAATTGASLATGLLTSVSHAAARTWLLAMPVYSSADGLPIDAGTVSCAGRMGKTKLKLIRAGFVGGQAVCFFRLAKPHARVAATVTVQSGGAAVVRRDTEQT